jgi:membrane protein
VFAFLLSAHLFLPARHHTLADVLPGVVLTMALWFSAGLTFSYWMSHFSTYSRTYAGLASAIALMLFFYIIALLFLLGAELNHAILVWRGLAPPRVPGKPEA